ncbi:MAG: OmpA family protein [Candidatus Kapabacteria bacterium]|nr:OmpA family protein [Candidatus Kapabacteria bacterium]
MSVARVFLVVFMTASIAYAQDLRPRYGLYAGVGMNLHSANFTALPNVPSCCPGYESGVGIAPSIIAVGLWPMSDKFLLGARIGYSPLSGSLTRTEATRVIQGATLVDGAFEHSIDATLNALTLEPTASFNVAGPLFVDGGLRFSFTPSPQFSQQEQITQPSNGGTFVDASGTDTRSRIRNAASGDLPSSSTHLAITIALRCEFPLNRDETFILSPEIGAGYGLTTLAGMDWRVHPFRAGITLFWQPAPSKDVQPLDPATPAELPLAIIPPQNSEIIAMPKGLDVTLAVLARNADGRLDTVDRIRVDETISEQITAVLPFVFFDLGSYHIDQRYLGRSNSDTPAFTEQALFGRGAIDVYHDLLNLVGLRMRQHPNARITLTGCILPDSVETEASGLAQRRAESVRDVLTMKWGIDPKRITVVARGLPEQPSGQRSEDGRSENRRVDIASNDQSILDLVRVEDTLRTSAPTELILTLGAQSDTTITEWSVTCTVSGRRMFTRSGAGQPPASVPVPLSVPVNEDPVEVEYIVVNAAGRRRVDDRVIPVDINTLAKKAERRQGLKRIDEYGLILFAFGKASMEGPNARIIDMIKGRIEPSSRVIVRGHADRTGSAELNLRLTQDRADAVSASLSAHNVDSKGVGQKNMLYDNDLPEGRFYNRTVRVRVETPISP